MSSSPDDNEDFSREGPIGAGSDSIANVNDHGFSTTAAQVKQRRVRSQLSCTPCRQGKLKCNRAHDPACDQCIKRNREAQCAYLPPPTKNKPSRNVKGRIRQLESLVVDLMNQNKMNQEKSQPILTSPDSSEPLSGATTSHVNVILPHSEPTPPSDAELPQDPSSRRREDASKTAFGRMRISKDEISYVGDSHWGAILGSISDLKRDFGADVDEANDDEGLAEDEVAPSEPTAVAWNAAPVSGIPQAAPGLGFMLGQGAQSSLTRRDLFAALPEKRVADRLLSQWFNSPDPFKPIIHAPTFQDEYRRLWREPQKTPTMWVGLLFAILSLATSFGLRNLDPNSEKARAILREAQKYHQLSAGAATLADFTKPKPHTLECLIVYSAGMRSNDAFVNVWLMMGLIVRLALRMGYHRDASHYPAISAFEGEMRRRTWAIISMIDVLISFQLGLPGMVKTVQADAKSPRNLLDRDFNTTTVTLPPDRSVHELTPSSYTRAKLGIVRVFADAAELSHATIAPAYEDMMALDRRLEEAKAAIPPMLQMPDISELVTDPAEQLMCRFNLALLYLKTKIVLHRRYMLTPMDRLSPEERLRGVGNSRMSCVDASVEVLRHHHTIYMASQPGGQLESVKWYMASISTHDFLLAAMIICLDLSHQMRDDDFRYMPNGLPCRRRADLVSALQRSHKIWSDSAKLRKARSQANSILEKSGQMFDETDTAAKALGVMLDRVRRTIGLESTIRTWPNADQAMALQTMSGGIEDDSHVLDRAFGSSSTAQDTSPSNYFEAVELTYPSSQPMTAGAPTLDQFSDLIDPQTQSNSQDSPDFALIGEMLDLNDISMLDWETWDNQINKNSNSLRADKNNTSIGTGGGLPMESHSDFAHGYVYNDEGLLAGNALVGGTGVVEPTPDSLVNEMQRMNGLTSTDPNIYQAQAGNFQYLWSHDDSLLNADVNLDMSAFNNMQPLSTNMADNLSARDLSRGMSGMSATDGSREVNLSFLEDVHFDLGVANYNRSGAYPASEADWAHYRARTGATR